MKLAPSDHFNGKTFFNICGQVRHLKEGLKWWLYANRPKPWPKEVKKRQHPLPPAQSERLRVTFIGHSTILIQIGGLNIVTDPIWAKRCAPFFGKRFKRVTSPGIPLEELPRIDLILLSHNHYDHCNIYTLKYLRKRDNPKIITGLGNKALLSKMHFQHIWELDWWKSVDIADGVKVTFVPAQHFSGRGPFDYNKTLWGGFVLECSGKTIYFAGDTGFCTHFTEIREQFPSLDLAFLPIGAYKPKSLMHLVHMSPEEAVRAHRILHAKTSIAIHFGCFHLSDEGFDEPCQILYDSLQKYKVKPTSFLVLEEGEGRNF